MHSFKIGDKVKIPKQKTIGVSYYDFQSSIKDNWEYLIVNSNSFNTIGVVGPNNEHISSNCFNPEDLELYVEPVEFEVGDEVEVIENSTEASKVGHKGKILGIAPYPSLYGYEIWGLPLNSIGAYIENSSAFSEKGYWHPFSDLKLIKKANMTTFKIGQKVELFQKTKGSSFISQHPLGYKGKIMEFGFNNDSVRIDVGHSPWVDMSDIRLVEERKIIGYKAPFTVNNLITTGDLVINLGDQQPNSCRYGIEGHRNQEGHYLSKEFVETQFTPVYEEPKPTEIIVILAWNNTKVSVYKSKIIAEGILFTEKDYIKLSNLFSQFNGTVGKPEKACYAETVKVGCTEIMRVEFLQIEKAWKQLN